MNIPPPPRCTNCEKAVYHAEQALGPGRKIYHRQCLTCTECKRRLDSFQMQEHDLKPYCRRCHTTLFGIRDLRSANVNSPLFPASSPSTTTRTLPPSSTPSRTAATSSLSSTPQPPSHSQPEERDRPKGSYDDFVMPTISSSSSASRPLPKPPTNPQPTDLFSPISQSTTSLSNAADLPKTTTTTTIRPDFSTSSPRPLPPSATTTPRSKVAMNLGGTPGGEGCEGCGKRVYAAEGVNAIGKRWHKGCLKCEDCGTTLNPGKVSDRNGLVYCKNCYHRSFGPPGIIGR